MKIYFLLASLLCLWPASAWPAALFGAEFELSDSVIFNAEDSQSVDSDAAVAAQKRLFNEYTRTCIPARTCHLEVISNSYDALEYRITFGDGFWVQISTDPGTLEIKTKPSTVNEYAKNSAHLEALFEAGKKVGLSPNYDKYAAGHIHLDFSSSFGNDRLLFRNFVVDFMNHQELGGLGVLGADEENAPHLSLLKKEQQKKFKKILKDFDRGKIKTAREFAKKMNDYVYYRSLDELDSPQKFQALNMVRMSLPDGEATLELRGIGAQESADEYLKQIKLVEARLQYLKKTNGTLKLLDLKKMTPAEQVRAFRAYVEESGLAWKDYRSMVRNHKRFATSKVKPKSRTKVSCEKSFSVLRDP